MVVLSIVAIIYGDYVLDQFIDIFMIIIQNNELVNVQESMSYSYTPEEQMESFSCFELEQPTPLSLSTYIDKLFICIKTQK